MKTYLKFKHNIPVFLVLLFCLQWAQAATILIPPAPNIAASSYILMDFNSGKILAEKNPDKPLPPASLTKLMTVYVVFKELASGHLSLNEKVTVSKKAWKMPGSRMFIEVGKQVSVEDLLKGVMIQSGNDASVALAEHVAGNESTFAALMNQNAERLKMLNTQFKNSTGLPEEGHYTTAHDLAILAQAIIKEFPEYYKWDSQKEFTYNNITQHNRNRLLWRDKSVDGLKTGHTEEAGYCLVASAKRGDMRLISVVMGTKSENARATESQALLNYGFRFFETRKLYDGQTPIIETRVYKGDQKLLGLGLAEDLYVTVPRRNAQDLKAETVVDKRIIAPVKTGDEKGLLRVMLLDEQIDSKPLIALNNIKKGSLFQRIYDEAMLLLDRK